MSFQPVIYCAIIGGSAIALSAVGVFLQSIDACPQAALLFSTVATAVSIVLALASMHYSQKSEKKTAETLDKIIENNQKLVDQINTALIERNMGKANIQNVRNELENR